MKTECPFCNQHYETEDENSGLKAECSMCGKVFTITPLRSQLLDGLNAEQIDAVKTPAGFVRVIAGAGTGKTRVLTRRLGYLIQELHIPADRILSVTFTNKAAREMDYRIRCLLGDSYKSRVSTFHGFCNTVLRAEIFHLCYPGNFTIMDEEDQKLLIREIFSEMGLSSRDAGFKEVKSRISLTKNDTGYVRCVVSPGAEELRETASDKLWTRIIKRYLWKQRKNFFLDYDDLIQFTLYLFESFPEVLAFWQEKLMYVQVDEFQDVNKSQYDLVLLLSGRHKNLFVVGDPDQTIYEWRGADVHFFLDFPADKTIMLHRNYRSTPDILKTSNALISHNQWHIDNPLDSIKKRGLSPSFFSADWEHSEGDWIAEKLLKQSAKRSYSDCAILCRSLFQTRKIEEALVKKSIPYHIYNGTDFYKRMEIKDALSYLRLIDQGDDLSFLRVINAPRRGMGKKRLELLKDSSAQTGKTLFQTLEDHLEDLKFHQCAEFVESIRNARKMAKDGVTVSDLLNNVLKETGYEAALLLDSDEERKNNLEELKQSVCNMEKEAEDPISLHDYLSQIALYSERNEAQGTAAVKVMTIHAAKGLEFPCVFVAGLNEGTLPNSHAILPEQIEQERRVAYVAFTRAEDELYLSCDNPERFNFSGEKMALSRFVSEIYETLNLKFHRVKFLGWRL